MILYKLLGGFACVVLLVSVAGAESKQQTGEKADCASRPTF
jgi:hypothetical protein